MKRKILSLVFSVLIIFINCLCMEENMLFPAIREGSYRQVAEIVAKDPGIVHIIRGSFSPLMKACLHDAVAIAQLLIDRGANPNQCNDKKLYAIHLVQSIEMMELLHTAGVDINTKNENNVPAFLFFAYKKRYDCIEWLLEKKAVVEGDFLERISNNKNLGEQAAIILLDMLKPYVQPDICCVCFEEKKWPEIRLIPCYSQGILKVVNHVNDALCNKCHEIIKITNSCPLCRKNLE
jgi:hypothetical protein